MELKPNDSETKKGVQGFKDYSSHTSVEPELFQGCPKLADDRTNSEEIKLFN